MPDLKIIRDTSTIISPIGLWTASLAHTLKEKNITEQHLEYISDYIIDCSLLESIDTVGALILLRPLFQNAPQTIINLRNATDAQSAIILGVYNIMRQSYPIGISSTTTTSKMHFQNFLIDCGRLGIIIYQDITSTLAMLGSSTMHLGNWILHPTKIRWTSIVAHLQRMAVDAVPIIGIMSFLIGSIITQQCAFYFNKFGVSIYTVDFTSVLVLREIGVFLTAIVVTGRTGSAITAEIGSMKMSEEVDFIRVMGSNPIEILVLPRLIALIIACPMLVIVADFCALIGSLLISSTYVGIPYDAFMSRLFIAVGPSELIVGLSKAPLMAIIICAIATSEGLDVQGNSESLGKHTTSSVVKAIFSIVAIDGLFAIFFSVLNI